MPVKLIVAAEDWQSKSVKCTFTVQAGDVTLVAKERSKQIYELPAGTNAVRVTATPTTSTGRRAPTGRRRWRWSSRATAPSRPGPGSAVGRREAGEWRHGGCDPGDGEGEPVQGGHA